MKHFLLAVAICAVMILSGCNTVQGFGKDVQAGGQALQNAATDVKQDIKHR